ncbi:hypothetical protein KGP36_03940 [Patescibacteria group bacterium]|nr:hypothetical protein [Patescibacteria group bacterium]
MTLERVLKAAVNAMIRGHHSPYCYSAHVPGKGYVNDGSAGFDRADYLKQLEWSARCEVDNLGFAPGYAEPGYAKPKRGVLFANWNVFPDKLQGILERMGYECEWSDEWALCDECEKAVRTEPSGYFWEPAFKEKEGSIVCRECYGDDDDE